MTDFELGPEDPAIAQIGLHVCASLGEPAHEHGPGFVGDIGERSDAHPVGEIESNSTFPMTLPFVDYFGSNDGNARAR